MQYVLRMYEKVAEEDDFENGCMPGTAAAHEMDFEFTGEDPRTVLTEFAELFSVEPCEIEVDEWSGDLTIGVMERADGSIATDLEDWRRGTETLWYATYRAELSSRETIELSAKELNEILEC